MSIYFTPLDREALLHVEGPDARTFLQGQTTCDVRTIDPEHALPGACCTPQGRIIFDFLMCQASEHHFVLRLRRDILKTSAATLAKYIVFSKAVIDSEQPNWRPFAVWGDGAHEVLKRIFTTVPDAQYDCVSGPGFVLAQLDALSQQFECYVDTATQPGIAAELASALSPASEDSWQALQIESGIARIETATTEHFIPQMLNYDFTGHLSFSKGCYTGQEVVARMHYRGTPKRRMYLATLQDEPATAGALLYSNGSEQSVGTVVNSTTTIDNKCIALVVATTESVTRELHLDSIDGPLICLGTLPYSLGNDTA
ncbi:MAG: folate-binding protein YgfZ [Halieaceae bacterium]|nr:folate-binding protein YgfZ [Halieaceae bacterium]